MPASCNPSDLVAAAKCFNCIPRATQEWVKLFLLCQVAANGGAGQVYFGIWANPNGNIVPGNPSVAAVYYQDDGAGTVNDWRWSARAQNWFPVVTT